MFNHFHLSRNELKLLRLIFTDAVQRASAAITDFVFIRDIVDDDFTRQVFRQWFTLRFIECIADGFLLRRFNIGSQFFRLIKQFTLTRVALGAFAKLFLLCNAELLFQVLIPVIQFLELLLQLSDAALIIFFVHKTIIAD